MPNTRPNISEYGALFDAHIHTYFDYHDGMITPQQLVNAVDRAGLNWVCAMAHDTCRGAPKIQKLAKEKGLPCITGIEISTTHNHLLGYGLHEWKIQRDSIDPDEAIELLREQDAAVFLAHPMSNPKGDKGGNWNPELVKRLDIDGLEWYNASTYIFNKRTHTAFPNFPDGRKIAGTDAHHHTCVGYSWTRVDVNSEDPDDVVAAMKKGKCTPYMHPVPFHKFIATAAYQQFKNKVIKRIKVEGRPIIADGDRPLTRIAEGMEPHHLWVDKMVERPMIPQVANWVE